MKLKEYFDKYSINIKKFSRQIGCTDSTIHRLLKGNKDCYLSLALAIEKETEGKVTPQDILCLDTQKI